MKSAIVWGALLLTAGTLSGAAAGGTVPPFQLADSDGNGFVDQEESRRVGLPAERFRAADTNGDSRLMPWEYRLVEEAVTPARRAQPQNSGGHQHGGP